MISSDRWSTEEEELKPVLEIWALYAYNLHKATYEGLNNLEVRKGKRNFIIGRGGFSGLHKWAGLWTGDNASTWDHFRISVSQVRTKNARSRYLFAIGLIAFVRRCLLSVCQVSKSRVQMSGVSCLPRASKKLAPDMRSRNC